MVVLKKLVFLLLVTVLSVAVLTLGTIAVFELGFLEGAEDLAENETFRLGYFGGIMWALFAGVLGGIVYFFVDNPERARWFLWAPVYMPLLYMAAAVTYFS